ncbi:MAG: PQQ-dependent dehydrogenase, methanol/ethanol family, partial [Acidobacteriota bacterium]|nr:PQQ-dependent dehydrogenase, methanol/ethanol family [Acidobacteriota bacterium]
MKKTAALLAVLLGVSSSPGLAQTDEDLINDAQTPGDVLIHSMGYDRKSYSPLEEINKSNIHRLVPIWSTSLMNQSGELAAPAIHDGVLYAINGSWTFAIDLETG